MKKFFVSLLFIFIPFLRAYAQMTEVEFYTTLENFSNHSDNIAKIFFPNQKLIPINGNYLQDMKEFSAGAMAQVNEGQISLYVAGWLVHSKFMDFDTLDFVLCHEIGHIVKKGLPNERLADDFASRDCLRFIWGENEDYLKRIEKASFNTWSIRSAYYEELGYSYDNSRCTIDLIRKASLKYEIKKEEFFKCEKKLLSKN